MFNTYTTTGSFSRSAVMDQCGAKTQLAAYIQVGRTPSACHLELPALLRIRVPQPLTLRSACTDLCAAPAPQDPAGWLLPLGHLVATMLVPCQV